MRARERLRHRVAREEADRARLERMTLQLAAGHAAVEDDRVHRHAREAEPQTVEHRDQRDRLALDAGLLEHFLHRDLRRRVADVGPTDRIQPPTGIGALGQQDLAAVVADDRRDRDLRRDVAGDTFADGAQPLVEEHVGFGFVDRGGADVGRDLQHLFEAFAFVEALREPEPGARDARQRLGPPQQVGRGIGEARECSCGPDPSQSCDRRARPAAARPRRGRRSCGASASRT